MERLQRILAARGVASRRKAEEMISAGRVSVDGQVVTELGTKADPIHAQIRVDGKLLKAQNPRYILLNKPRGYITTMQDERDRWTVMDLVQTKERVYPVGRLDRDTEGLLLLTNDGDVANRVMHPRYGLDKEYHVITTIRPTEATMQRVRSGLSIEGKKVTPHEFRIFRESREGIVLTITLHEGVNHVVRRMMDAASIPVERLRRVRIGPLTLSTVPPGGWRDLTPGEMSTLFEAIGLSREGALPKPQPGETGSREVHFTRRLPRPATTQGQRTSIITPRAPQTRPVTVPVASTQEPRQRAEPSSAPTSKSRRRRGEPPAPLPTRQRTERPATGRREDDTEQRGRPAPRRQPPRGKHDEQQRDGGGKPGERSKQRTPEGGRDRRPSGGRQDNSGKPRRRAPRRDAV